MQLLATHSIRTIIQFHNTSSSHTSVSNVTNTSSTIIIAANVVSLLAEEITFVYFNEK